LTTLRRYVTALLALGVDPAGVDPPLPGALVTRSSVHVDLAFALYSAWARENVRKPLLRRQFESALEIAGYEKCRVPAKGGTMRWCGMKPKTLEDLPSCVSTALWVYGRNQTNTIQN
jgi:hypothetical protein